MNELHFAFDGTDILLTPDGDIPRTADFLGDMCKWETVTCLQEPADKRQGKGEVLHCHLYFIAAPSRHQSPHWQRLPLRQAMAVLPPHLAALAAKCSEIVHWHTQSRYCGLCGAPTAWKTVISKVCTQCGHEQWPHIHTAVIVRITRTAPSSAAGGIHGNEASGSAASLVEEIGSAAWPVQEILMVRARNFRGPYYGLVAGFLEAGETLEQCVRREVLEETGLTIRDLRYHSSQVWPFPSQLMVAFTARYAGGTLRPQPEEIADAGWYAPDRLPPLPPSPSVARRLIDEWLTGLSCPTPEPIPDK